MPAYDGPMARTYERLDDRLRDFLLRQYVFFVATAPLSGEGHVNVSPKGMSGSFALIDDASVAYLDLTGSGVETVAHLRENGRIVLMFCAFEGPPRIVRLHGTGEVIAPDDPRFGELIVRFPPREGTRSVILVGLTRISDSCGYGVPLMDYVADRSQLTEWSHRKGPSGLEQYWREKNSLSIDRLPGFPLTTR